MASTRKLLREEAGVKLFEVGEPKSFGKANGCHYRISTMRRNQPMVLADLTEAQDAFDLEVIASLMDPVVQHLIARH
ncbi:hypothetical protein [Brevundimonas sp.]|uniref:hypothetical protein n=1 Tax=Brevundimonas sp. TaxID=1871086 RepID=UPI0035658252